MSRLFTVPALVKVSPPATTSSVYEVMVGRVDERKRLQARFSQRKSMLVFGEKGVGKTHLLRALSSQLKNALYVREASSPRNVLLSILEAARQSRVPSLQIPRNLDSLSVCSLKGVVHRVLDANAWILFLDQIKGPASTLCHLLKELNYYDRTPLIMAARSPHMEDIGYLQPLCSDRSEQLELRNWSEAVALEFARREATEISLTSQNLHSALTAMVEMSNGNPGAILQMLQMAKLDRYRTDDQIKFHVLYLDYRMNGPMALVSPKARHTR